MFFFILFSFLLESTDVSKGAEMIHLVLLLPLCAGAALVAQVWLQGVCLLLQCSFSSFYKNTHFLWFPGQLQQSVQVLKQINIILDYIA